MFHYASIVSLNDKILPDTVVFPNFERRRSSFAKLYTHSMDTLLMAAVFDRILLTVMLIITKNIMPKYTLLNLLYTTQ